MATRVCLAANTIYYPAGFWPYLNWALSFQAAGCELVWLEGLDYDQSSETLVDAVGVIRGQLEPFGLDHAVVLATGEGGEVLPKPPGTRPLEAALEADVLVDLGYMPPSLVRRFPRSAFVDLDPGVTQIWASRGELDIGGHDVYYTIGEAAKAGGARFPDCGIEWLYTQPPVALAEWQPQQPAADGAHTTISHWWDSTTVEIDGVWVENSKRAGFAPFLDLPRRTSARLELVLGGLDDEDERHELERFGWRVRDAEGLTSTPDGYRDHILTSRGEFSAAKPPYVILRSGWLNDRTASFLAAGKPVVLQSTGRTLFPVDEGLFRFETVDEAAHALEAVEADYGRHSSSARALAEEQFDGVKVVTRLLERLLA